jgi:hypothetical protein
MNKKRAQVFFGVLGLALFFGLFSGSVVASELADTNIPDEVAVDGEFDASITVDESENTLVTVESNDFNVEVTTQDADGQAQGGEVVYINIGNTDTLTHNFNVDISGASPGDTGTVSIVDNSPDDGFNRTITFSIQANRSAAGSNDTDLGNTDGGETEDVGEDETEGTDDQEAMEDGQRQNSAEESEEGAEDNGADGPAGESGGEEGLPGFTALSVLVAIFVFHYAVYARSS